MRAEAALVFAARDDALANGDIQLWRQIGTGALQKKRNIQPADQDDWIETKWENACPPASDSYFATYLFHAKDVKKVKLDVLRKSGVRVSSIENIRTYFTKQSKELKRSLSDAQLSWQDQAVDNLGHFRHGHHIANSGGGSDRGKNWEIIDTWIRQFDQFGARSVGEALARLLLVQRPEVLVAESEIGTSSHYQQLPFLAALSGLGKSGGVLLQNASKYTRQQASGCIGAGISWYVKNSPSETLNVIEDGLWTGFEFFKVLDALEGRKFHAAIQTLDDPRQLSAVQVRLHFLVSTDIGIATLKSILQERKLTNFELAPSPRYINVLSDVARGKFQSGEYSYLDVIHDRIPSSEIMPAILSEQRPWLNDAMRMAIAKLIREKGGLLYPVPSKLVQPRHEAWPFGASFIGSHMVFAHSSPRAALPFYWKSGVFGERGKQFKWKALVPETVEIVDASARESF
ncbi:hypothetical protein [Herbaspirillum robiniae]|uniref:DUF927 domain-containing protein n=1 Tax=Herbaspirillum robiniae TaxID=2014887 RepID=A0ABX2M2A8_9BURK|nr:hypothetical protein [Herbaspirillum robiniae]NUU03520.1 hypothetical protein [Herbaspirillum robiniae]